MNFISESFSELTLVDTILKNDLVNYFMNNDVEEKKTFNIFFNLLY